MLVTQTMHVLARARVPGGEGENQCEVGYKQISTHDLYIATLVFVLRIGLSVIEVFLCPCSLSGDIRTRSCRRPWDNEIITFRISQENAMKTRYMNISAGSSLV